MNFVFLVLLSSVSVVDAPESEVIGSHEPVNATVGDDVILPCHLEPPFDLNNVTVEWNRNKIIVHVFRNRKDDPGPQNENFRGRTSLFHDEMVRGNISLKLSNVTERDAGNYTCFVPKLQSQVRRGFVNLTVEPARERNEESASRNEESASRNEESASRNEESASRNEESASSPSVDTAISTGAVIGITAAIVIAIVIIFGLWLVFRNRCAGQAGSGRRQEYQMAERNE